MFSFQARLMYCTILRKSKIRERTTINTQKNRHRYSRKTEILSIFMVDILCLCVDTFFRYQSFCCMHILYVEPRLCEYFWLTKEAVCWIVWPNYHEYYYLSFVRFIVMKEKMLHVDWITVSVSTVFHFSA